MNFVLITTEFAIHAITGIIHFFTSYKLHAARSSVTTHGGKRLKQRASIRQALLGSFDIISLIISSIIQILAVVIGYTSDQIMVLIMGLLLYELFLPLLYTFTTTAFTQAVSSAISHI